MDWNKMSAQFDDIITNFDNWQKKKCNGEWSDICLFMWEYTNTTFDKNGKRIINDFSFDYTGYVRDMPFCGTVDSVVRFLQDKHFKLSQAQALVAAALVYVLQMYDDEKSAEIIFGDLSDDILEMNKNMRDRGYKPLFRDSEGLGYYGSTYVVMPRVPKHICEDYSAKNGGKDIRDTFVSEKMLPTDGDVLRCKMDDRIGRSLPLDDDDGMTPEESKTDREKFDKTMERIKAIYEENHGPWGDPVYRVARWYDESDFLEEPFNLSICKKGSVAEVESFLVEEGFKHTEAFTMICAAAFARITDCGIDDFFSTHYLEDVLSVMKAGGMSIDGMQKKYSVALEGKKGQYIDWSMDPVYVPSNDASDFDCFAND